MLNKVNPSDLKESDNHVKVIIDQISDKLSENYGVNNILDNKFTQKELLYGIKKLKNGKASGCDAISNDIIKAVSREISPVLCDIFNVLLEIEHYPIQWATGLIMPLHKSGDLGEPNNYRGITINSCLSKLFTLLLNERLTIFCEINKVIGDR